MESSEEFGTQEKHPTERERLAFSSGGTSANVDRGQRNRNWCPFTQTF